MPACCLRSCIRSCSFAFGDSRACELLAIMMQPVFEVFDDEAGSMWRTLLRSSAIVSHLVHLTHRPQQPYTPTPHIAHISHTLRSTSYPHTAI